MDEIDNIRERYKRRKQIPASRYSILNPPNYLIEQEKERALIRWIKNNAIEPLDNKRFLEIGCGEGFNIQKFIRFGFNPANISVNELLDERIVNAQRNLPSQINFLPGNALDLHFPDETFDVVFQSMVFSSILDDRFRENLAAKMWKWVKPGGGILWYDFIFNNPSNPDVKGVPLNEVKRLFSRDSVYCRRITLAPPLARFATKIHPNMYNILNSFFFLRTHMLIWIIK